jgi:ABC-type antimicrobial peptide transport system permease subunit
LLDSIRHAVSSVDSGVPIFAVKSMDEFLADANSFRRLAASLIGLFAGLAVILAGIGLYGVMAYAVTQRTREIGIRMALGAKRSDVLRMIVAQGMRMGAIGIAAGIIGAVALSRLMASLVYQTSTTDIGIFVAVGLSLMVFVLLACYVPSWRATRVDPNVALRCE